MNESYLTTNVTQYDLSVERNFGEVATSTQLLRVWRQAWATTFVMPVMFARIYGGRTGWNPVGTVYAAGWRGMPLHCYMKLGSVLILVSTAWLHLKVEEPRCRFRGRVRALLGLV